MSTPASPSSLLSPNPSARWKWKRQVPLPNQDIFRLILVYRWLSLIPPTVGLFVANEFKTTTLFFYPLAILWLIWLTGRWWLARRHLSEARTSPPRFSLTVDLIFCAVLIGANGMWASPYYLYSLGPIFGVAFFYGLRPSLLVSLFFSLGYLSVLGANLFLGLGGDWLVSISNVTGFVLFSVLFGYQSMVTRQLRHQTELAEKYRLEAEEQNARVQERNGKLDRANRDLEMVRVFSRALQLGVDNHSVYAIALQQIATIETIESAALQQFSK